MGYNDNCGDVGTGTNTGNEGGTGGSTGTGGHGGTGIPNPDITSPTQGEEPWRKILECNSELLQIEGAVTWLQSHKHQAGQISNYLQDNCNAQSWEFALQGIQAEIEGGETDWVLQNINRLTNPCAKEIFNELENGIYTQDILHPEVDVVISGSEILELNFSEYVLYLFNESETFKYVIQNGTPNNPNANASTLGATTIINNNYLNSATQLSIARTMIHELVHAYLNIRYSNFLSFPDGYSFRQLMEQYAQENGISNIQSNEFHHEFMGQYINAMAYSLYEWDKEYGTGSGNNFVNGPEDLLGWDYYHAMAFSGQFTTDAFGTITSTTDTFQELIPDATERQNIVNVILNEQLNNNDAEGTECN